VGSNDLTAQILLEFANQEGEELARYHDWQALVVQKTFTTLAQVAQTNALPSDDYDRMVYSPEVWNRSLNLRYRGPTNSREWQRVLTGVGAGVAGWWRIVGGELNIYPAPTAGQTLAFEYISRNWAESSGGTAQDSFMADTDVSLLPERIILLGMVWRYRHSRGFAQYAEDMATYEREKEKAAARDRATGRITPSGGDDGINDASNIVVEVSA
jgi:hypothetical protein